MTVFDGDALSYVRIIQILVAGFGASIEAGCNEAQEALIFMAGRVGFPTPLRLSLGTIDPSHCLALLANVAPVIRACSAADLSALQFAPQAA